MGPTKHAARRALWVVPLLVLTACPEGMVGEPLDGGNSDGATEMRDASEPVDGTIIEDSGGLDTGPFDTGGSMDAGPVDGGSGMDAGPVDTGAVDAGPVDTGVLVDAGTADAGSGDGVPSDMQALFDLMNAARLATGSTPFVWNAGVAQTADTWAAGCTWMHAPANQRIYMGAQMGENLSGGSGTSWSAGALGQGWVDEQTDYDCPNNACAANQICGHYTQVIWRNSTEVGCALRTCATGSPFGNGSGSWRFLVCRYLPAGNYGNQRPIPVGDCP